jgi:hypothetical protein
MTTKGQYLFMIPQLYPRNLLTQSASGAKAHIYVQLAAGLSRDWGGTVEGLKALILLRGVEVSGRKGTVQRKVQACRLFDAGVRRQSPARPRAEGPAQFDTKLQTQDTRVKP